MKSEIRDLFKFLDNARSIYHVADYARNYTSPEEIQVFMESRKLADQKTVDIVKQIIYYNSQTNSFEQTQEKTGRTL